MTTIELPCLTIRQPWAGFIMMGKKPVENRSWSHKYCGPMLIHSSQGRNFPDVPVKYYKAAGLSPDDLDHYRWWPEFQTGVILGVVRKCTCVFKPRAVQTPSIWHDRGYCWWPMLTAAMFDQPIRYRGQLGVFQAEIDLKTSLAAGGTLGDYMAEYDKVKQREVFNVRK